MNILVVDDIEEYLDTIEGFLEDEHNVFKAKNLPEAKEILKKEKMHIAIVDIRLDENDPSNKDGLELLKWIKEQNLDLPVIVMSAYREFDYAVDAINLGAKYFIKKPIDPNKLLEIIQEFGE